MSQSSRPSDPNFNRNVNRFFAGSHPATPQGQEQELKLNAEKFFNSGLTKPLNPNHSDTNFPLITKQKTNIPKVDIQSIEFKDNLANFYGQPLNQSAKEYQSNEAKRSSSRPLSAVEQKNYKFGLSRSEIAKPGQNQLTQGIVSPGGNVRPSSSVSRTSFHSAVSK